MGSVLAERTLEQRLDALAAANEVRYTRARMKASLAAGADPGPLLVAPPPWLDRMKAHQFLLALPKVGPRKSRRIMAACRISEGKTVGGLSWRQRLDLLLVVAPTSAATYQRTLQAARGPSGPPADGVGAPVASEHAEGV